MEHSQDISVLAIDGGGTRCRIAISKGDKIVLSETGSANISTDFEGAVHEVLRGLNGLATQLNWPVDTLAALPAFIGLAGVSEPKMADRLRAALPFHKMRIADDRPAALRGALGEKDGFIAHCGTGSFYAAQQKGAARFAGGWGPVLGDEASAHWIGRAALKATLRSVDGHIAPSPLTERLLKDFGDASGIIRFARTARPADFGELARRVTDCAAHGDALARDIMHKGALEIIDSLPKLGWTEGDAICLTGGIGPHFAPYLPAKMKESVVYPEGEPLVGAIALARDFAKEPAYAHR
ncbi:BadF/BadG/BcrA/BcrD ATPase family protein [Paracoccaceae bacterium GXU_MW_L88]